VTAWQLDLHVEGDQVVISKERWFGEACSEKEFCVVDVPSFSQSWGWDLH
jgi:hypothetical protein